MASTDNLRTNGEEKESMENANMNIGKSKRFNRHQFFNTSRGKMSERREFQLLTLTVPVVLEGQTGGSF